MIFTTVDIPNIEQTIVRPSVVSVMNDLKYLFRIDTNIYTSIENTIEQISNIESLLTKPISFIYGDNQNSKLEVSYTEEIDRDRVLTNNIDRLDTNPIIYDSELDMLIRAIYYFTKLEIRLKYLTKSKNDITHFTNTLKLQIVKNSDTNYHTLQHRVHFPTVIVEFIKTIYDIRESQIPTVNTIEDYLRSISNSTLVYASTQDRELSLVHTDIQRSVVGYYTDEVESIKPEYDKETGYYSVEVSYTITYNKPIQLYLRYPEIVYNTLLPDKYLVERDYILERVKDIDRVDNNFIKGLQEFIVTPRDGYLRIPSFDNYTLPTPKPQMVRVFSVLVIPDSDYFLCNLNELNNFSLDPKIYNCLVNGEYQYLLEPYQSVFHLEFYKDKTLLDSTKYLRIDSNLNIYYTQPLDIRRTYRLSLSIVLDTDYLPKLAIERIEKCDILNILFKILNIDTNYFVPYTASKYNSNTYAISVHTLLRYFE